MLFATFVPQFLVWFQKKRQKKREHDFLHQRTSYEASLALIWTKLLFSLAMVGVHFFCCCPSWPFTFACTCRLLWFWLHVTRRWLCCAWLPHSGTNFVTKVQPPRNCTQSATGSVCYKLHCGQISLLNSMFQDVVKCCLSVDVTVVVRIQSNFSIAKRIVQKQNQKKKTLEFSSLRWEVTQKQTLSEKYDT